MKGSTVDGRNPANHLAYIKPCKHWGKLTINWLAGFLPSTASPLYIHSTTHLFVTAHVKAVKEKWAFLFKFWMLEAHTKKVRIDVTKQVWCAFLF